MGGAQGRVRQGEAYLFEDLLRLGTLPVSALFGIRLLDRLRRREADCKPADKRGTNAASGRRTHWSERRSVGVVECFSGKSLPAPARRTGTEGG